MNSVLICTKKDCKSEPTVNYNVTHDYNASILDLLTGLSECIYNTHMILYMIQLTPYHVPTNPMAGVSWHVWHGHVHIRFSK